LVYLLSIRGLILLRNNWLWTVCNYVIMSINHTQNHCNIFGLVSIHFWTFLVLGFISLVWTLSAQVQTFRLWEFAHSDVYQYLFCLKQIWYIFRHTIAIRIDRKSFKLKYEKWIDVFLDIVFPHLKMCFDQMFNF